MELAYRISLVSICKSRIYKGGQFDGVVGNKSSVGVGLTFVLMGTSFLKVTSSAHPGWVVYVYRHVKYTYTSIYNTTRDLSTIPVIAFSGYNLSGTDGR